MSDRMYLLLHLLPMDYPLELRKVVPMVRMELVMEQEMEFPWLEIGSGSGCCCGRSRGRCRC